MGRRGYRPADAGVPQRHAVPGSDGLGRMVQVVPASAGGGGVVTQTRWQSFVEVNASTAVGFVVSWLATPPILWLFGYEAGAAKAFGITVVYTVLSLVRGWV